MNLFIPNLRRTSLPCMLRLALAGSLVAGCYGILHDQITYSISAEYFTRMKFEQFDYADFGFPPRVFVAEIGFLATWWVGFFAGWFVARVTVPAFPHAVAFRHGVRGLFIVFASAFLAGITGWALGAAHGPDYSSWEDTATTLGIADLPGFVRVAYIHNAGYLGCIIGLIAAIIHLRRIVRGRCSHVEGTGDLGRI